jgi:hypothetical protein
MDRFFHRMEQHHGIRLAEHRFRPVTAPLVPSTSQEPNNPTSNDGAYWDGLPISLGLLAWSRSMITPIIFIVASHVNEAARCKWFS